MAAGAAYLIVASILKLSVVEIILRRIAVLFFVRGFDVVFLQRETMPYGFPLIDLAICRWPNRAGQKSAIVRKLLKISWHYHTNVHFVFIGSGAVEGETRALTEKWRPAERVRVLGWISFIEE